jgi:hypothetical protein
MINRYFVIIVIIFTSCTPPEETATLEIDVFQQNELIPEVSDISIIRPENRENSLIGEITKVDFKDNKYYILDLLQSRTLFVFDSAGSFINKTIHGNGPGEVIFPWSFNFDPDSGLIMVWDSDKRKMLFYDPDLNYQHSLSNNDMILWDFEKYNDGRFLTYTQFADISRTDHADNYYYYYLRNEKGDVLDQYLPCINEKLTHYILISPIWREETNTYLITPFDFNIYSFKDNSVVPCMNIELGSVSLKVDQLENTDFSYQEFMESGSRVLALDYLINTDRFLAFSYYLNHERQFVIYSKMKDETYYSEVLFRNGIIPKCKLQSFRDERFIGVVDPIDYIEYIAKTNDFNNQIEEPSEMDNQYIITFKIN